MAICSWGSGRCGKVLMLTMVGVDETAVGWTIVLDADERAAVAVAEDD